jgi:DnaJ-class molecular chaperone
MNGEVKNMNHAEKCPICKGVGKVCSNEYATCPDATCHGCNGKGWVTVEDKTKSGSKVTLVTNEKV